MPITVHWDTIREMDMVERDGAVISLTRGVIVEGLTEANYKNMFQALNNAGLPIANTSLDTSYPDLRLVGRRVQPLPDSPDKGEVILEYAHLGVSEDNNFILHGSGTMQQTTTQVDMYGNAVAVGHEYAEDDPIVENLPANPHVIGVEAPVLQAESTMWATGVIPVNYPFLIQARYQGCVNAYYWAGGPAGTWLCTQVSWDPHNLHSLPRQWKFRFEWQFRKEGWQPTAVYCDPRTGRPPDGLVPGYGAVQFEWYPTVDFAERFRDV
jgi:hypothetical protein